MPTLTLNDDQVLALIRQLPTERKRAILYSLAEESEALAEALIDQGEAHIRSLCLQRGLDWDGMNEIERETFLDAIWHEDK